MTRNKCSAVQEIGTKPCTFQIKAIKQFFHSVKNVTSAFISHSLSSVYCKALCILCLHVHVVLSIKTLDFRIKYKILKLFCQDGRFFCLAAC